MLSCELCLFLFTLCFSFPLSCFVWAISSYHNYLPVFLSFFVASQLILLFSFLISIFLSFFLSLLLPSLFFFNLSFFLSFSISFFLSFYFSFFLSVYLLARKSGRQYLSMGWVWKWSEKTSSLYQQLTRLLKSKSFVIFVFVDNFCLLTTHVPYDSKQETILGGWRIYN